MYVHVLKNKALINEAINNGPSRSYQISFCLLSQRNKMFNSLFKKRLQTNAKMKLQIVEWEKLIFYLIAFLGFAGIMIIIIFRGWGWGG